MSGTGSWNLTLNSPLGDQAVKLDIHDADGTLQGTLTGKGDATALQRLTVEGTKLTSSLFIKRSRNTGARLSP